jgi:hypothetical protein
VSLDRSLASPHYCQSVIFLDDATSGEEIEVVQTESQPKVEIKVDV